LRDTDTASYTVFCIHVNFTTNTFACALPLPVTVALPLTVRAGYAHLPARYRSSAFATTAAAIPHHHALPRHHAAHGTPWRTTVRVYSLPGFVTASYLSILDVPCHSPQKHLAVLHPTSSCSMHAFFFTYLCASDCSSRPSSPPPPAFMYTVLCSPYMPIFLLACAFVPLYIRYLRMDCHVLLYGLYTWGRLTCRPLFCTLPHHTTTLPCSYFSTMLP